MSWTRRQFLTRGLALGAALAGTDQYWEYHHRHFNGSTPWSEDPREEASLTVKEASHVRLLQVTDLHFRHYPRPDKADAATREDLLRLVERHQPDLLLVTGDLWNDNPMHLGLASLQYSLERLQELGVPWLFTWGNHDRLDRDAPGHACLTRASGSLYRGGPQGGCYTVQLCDPQGQPCWDLFCLNSQDVGLGPASLQWLEGAHQRGQRARHSFAVFHIPLRQYESSQVEGVHLEACCFEQEDGSALGRLAQVPGLQACLVGHDHINDYQVDCQGIQLIYGRATGYGGYGGERVPKGAKLYHLNAENGRFHWTSVRAQGADWSPTGPADQWEKRLWG